MKGRPGEDRLGRAPAAPEDCTTCGRCCFSDQEGYIRVFRADEERMDERAMALTERRGAGRSMRFVDGRCVALRRDGVRWVCGIYPMRPDACRWLERGSGHCLDIILAHELRRSPEGSSTPS